MMTTMFRLGTFLKCKYIDSFKVIRPFMSEGFQCKDAWSKRLNGNILKKVNPSEMYYELDNKFNQIGKVSAVDVDIFTNALNDKTYLDEMEELVHRFRLTSEAGKILDSTHHAFIRVLFSFGDVGELIRILNDRLNYGIFPDNYCNVLLMDQFIKENNFTNAAKIATLQMLQEDFNNPLVKYFSLYSCHKYLLEPSAWEMPVEEEPKSENGEDSEEVKVRVDYIRNPYFDDHFDLTDPYSLIGKTFKMIAQNENDALFNSYHLLGLILYKKWPEAEIFSNNVVSRNEKIHADSISEIEKFLESFPQVEGEKGNEIYENIDQIKNNITKFKRNNLIAENSLINATQERLNLSIKDLEQKVIEEQCQVYEKWENEREAVLQNELEEINRLQRIENVKLKKEELAKKEQELFFFDVEDELDLKIENKRAKYPPGKENERSDSLEYIPPDVITSKSQ